MGEGCVARRAALAGAGIALAGMVGCSRGDEPPGREEPARNGGYLPIGSTVRLSGMPEGFDHVVVARRAPHAGAGAVFDYALVQAVLGMTSDLSGADGLYAGELVLADEGDIAEVLQVGLVTDEELRAEELLAEGVGTDEAAVRLLLPIIEERAETLKGGGNGG